MLNLDNARSYLSEFDFVHLFTEELGWNYPSSQENGSFNVEGHTYDKKAIAELSGIIIFEVYRLDGQIPGDKDRLAVQKHIEKYYYENVLIFIDQHRRQCVWYWVKRDGNKRFPRSHSFVSNQSGDLLLSKLSAMFVDIGELNEKGKIPIVEAAWRVKQALDVEPVTKRFYEAFKNVHFQFLEYIRGIDSEADRRWYASVVLNRLMFIYFLQKKGFVDAGNLNYLQDKLKESRIRGTDHYYTGFLIPLFFDGFARPPDQRSSETNLLIGQVRYLNGGLFLRHQIEERWPSIIIPDDAFDKLFIVFANFSWNLDDRIGGRDDEINPDVLGYIFEKYINQKAFGAYYTRPEITEYLSEHTIHKFILSKLADLNEPISPLTSIQQYESVGDLLLKLDATRCRQLLFDVLPSLKILDPACGSGAFLVAAMQTLLEIYRGALGKIPFFKDRGLQDFLDKVDHDHPSREYYIKKRIITDNLFGVDIMDEAVEIARLRLFLALVSSAQREEDLEPLPNIDFNILHGNSLIGLLQVDEERFNKSVEIDTSTDFIPEQSTLFPTLKQGSLLSLMRTKSFRRVVEEKTQMVERYRYATERPDLKNNTEAVRALRDEIIAHRFRNADVLDQLLLEDLQNLKIKYEQANWDLHNGKPGKHTKRPLLLKDIRQLYPFHWGYEFDEVMNGRGGFDIIIANPPWETWKPVAKEFLSDYADTISKYTMTPADFEEKQAELMQDDMIREAWEQYASKFPFQSSFFRASPQFSYQSVVVAGKKTGGDINLYKLFFEQCHNLLRIGGLCGIIVPAGICTEKGATGLRRLLLDHSKVSGVFGFENRKGIFEGVHQSYQFVLISYEKGGLTESFPATYMKQDVEDLALFPQNAIHTHVGQIKRLSPEMLVCSAFESSLDSQIADKLAHFPLLGDTGIGPWQFRLIREFDMTNDSDLFLNSPETEALPLYEGKMIHQYDHLFSEPRFWVNERRGRQRVLGSDRTDSGQLLDYQRYRLAYRTTGEKTNNRNLICTILPHNCFCGNSLGLSKGTYDPDLLLFLCALMNSFILDYNIRTRITRNINMFHVYDLPIPRLTSSDWRYRTIVNRAAKLIGVTSDFDDLMAAMGLDDHKNGESNPNIRDVLRAEIDGLIAHLYGLTHEEFTHILDTFPAVESGKKEATIQQYVRFAPNPEIIALISGGEGQHVEFKQTACLNPSTGNKEISIRGKIIRAVAGFMNAEGGSLFIGVRDEDGKITGINDEYSHANPQKNNWDGYKLFLTDLLNTNLQLSAPFQYYEISHRTIEGLDLAIIKIMPTPEPVYVEKHFYVRNGNQTRELLGPDLVEYVKNHWDKSGT